MAMRIVERAVCHGFGMEDGCGDVPETGALWHGSERSVASRIWDGSVPIRAGLRSETMLVTAAIAEVRR
jgi:hypothetical protein